MKYFYVYILECADDSFYIGVTNIVGRRFIEHSTGLKEDSYTFNRRPLKLVFCRQFTKPMEAINFEKQVKGWTRQKKVALINYNYENLHELARCKNESSHLRFHKSE